MSHMLERTFLLSWLLISVVSFRLSSRYNGRQWSPTVGKRFPLGHVPPSMDRHRRLFWSVLDEEAEDEVPINVPDEMNEFVNPKRVDFEESAYPIDLPSPVLLGLSMFVAIAATGSIFELAGGNPQYGVAVSGTVATLGVPGCFFLFYAAIKKGTAETEEDDMKYMGGGGRRY